ncbi:hypothetical protein HMPREF9352_0489 [Streptococcus gallolyticus subsp. gallolyticus TX20005]|nr:hypothetical protein HMPREF9352_0489 [Streptococcus gallolyticus subsp. gallolyticus TX20005]
MTFVMFWRQKKKLGQKVLNFFVYIVIIYKTQWFELQQSGDRPF